MIRDKYRRAWLRFHKQYERKAQGLLLKYFKQQANKVPYIFLQEDNYKDSIANAIKIGGLYEVYFEIYKVVGLLHGERVGKQINRDIKEFNNIRFQSEYFRNLYEWVIGNVGHRIVSVRGEYIKHIQELVANAFRDGLTPQQLSAQIHALINRKDFYRWQALRIARTESSAGANMSAVMAGNSAGVVWDKEWISIPDNRVRTLANGSMFDHRAMDGVRVPKDGYFNINGELLPHPSALRTNTGALSSAGNVINCRCTVAVIVRRDAQGRVVRVAEGTQPIPFKPSPIRGMSQLPKPIIEPIPNVFVRAKTRAEAVRRLKALGIGKVNLRGTTPDQYNIILKTLWEEARFGGMTVKELTIVNSTRSNANGTYFPRTKKIRLNLSKLAGHKGDDIVSYADQIKKWTEQRDEIEGYVGNFRYNQRGLRGFIKEYDESIKLTQRKIDAGEKARYWSVSYSQKNGLDKLRATLLHEMGHHRQYTQTGIMRKFEFHPRLSLSEYGRINHKEYFVEWYAHWRLYGDNSIPKIPQDLLRLFKLLKL